MCSAAGPLIVRNKGVSIAKIRVVKLDFLKNSLRKDQPFENRESLGNQIPYGWKGPWG